MQFLQRPKHDSSGSIHRYNSLKHKLAMTVPKKTHLVQEHNFKENQRAQGQGAEKLNGENLEKLRIRNPGSSPRGLPDILSRPSHIGEQ